MSLQKITKGISLLTLAGIISKILSAAYRIPLQNIVGDYGFYVYQQAYPIYGLCLSLTLSGVPLFIAKELLQTKEEERIEKQGQLLCLLFLVGIVIFLLLFFFAPVMAQKMGNRALAPLIQVNALLFVIAPFLSFARGKSQKELTLNHFAYSQVIEQSVRVTFILGITMLGIYCFPKLTIYPIATLALGGSFVGMLCSTLYLQKREGIHWHFSWPKKSLFQRFWQHCFVLALGLSLLLVLQGMDALMDIPLLQKGGWSLEEAQVAKGVYDRGQPLLQMGLAILTSLVSGFAPQLLQAHKEKKKCLEKRKTVILRKGICFYGLGASLGLFGLMPFLNTILFENKMGSVSLSLLMFAIFLMAMYQYWIVVAQKEEKEGKIIWSLLCAILVKMIGNLLLIPKCHFLGVVISTLCSLIVANYSLKWQLKERERLPFHFYWQQGIALTIFGGLMFVSFFLGLKMEYSRGEALLWFFLFFVLGGGSYLWVVFQQRMFSLRDWLQLPFGKYFAKIGGK